MTDLNVSAALGPAERSLTLWASVLGLVPALSWLAFSIATDPGPMWRAQYFAGKELSGEPVSRLERKLERYWDRDHSQVAGDLLVSSFSARHETCLELERAMDVPFMLVAAGIAELSIDGQPALALRAEKGRQTRGAMVHLPSGSHHLRVEFSARNWPSIALYASFDGTAPATLPPERELSGVRFYLPAAGGSCAGRH